MTGVLPLQKKKKRKLKQNKKKSFLWKNEFVALVLPFQKKKLKQNQNNEVFYEIIKPFKKKENEKEKLSKLTHNWH